MFRACLITIFLVGQLSTQAALAEPISTTSCGAPQAINETRKQDGKTLKCTSKTVCKTTTCQTGGTANCSITTSTSYDCTEVASAPSRPRPGLVNEIKPGMLEPGRRPAKRQTLEAAPQGELYRDPN